MRYLLALLLCAAPVAAQEMALPENPHTLVRGVDGSGVRISGAVFAPDGARVALHGRDDSDPKLPYSKGALQIWDVKTRKLVFNLVGHATWVNTVLWSRDGKFLASQSLDNQIRVWDAVAGKPLHVLATRPQMPDFSPLTGGDQNANRALRSEFRLWLAMWMPPHLLGFSADSQQVLTLSGKIVVSPTAKKLPAALEAENFANFATPLLNAWDAKTGRLARAVPFGKTRMTIWQSALSEDGRSFVSYHDPDDRDENSIDRIETRDAVSGALRDSFQPQGKFVVPDVLSAHGQRVIMSSLKNGRQAEGLAQIWDVKTKKPLHILAHSNAQFDRVTFTHDGNTLFVGGINGDILIFDIQNGTLKRRLSGGHHSELATLDITADDRTLISIGARDGLVQLWDLDAP